MSSDGVCVGLSLEDGAVGNEEMSKRISCNDRGWDDNVRRHCWSSERKEWSKEFGLAGVGFQHAYGAGHVVHLPGFCSVLVVLPLFLAKGRVGCACSGASSRTPATLSAENEAYAPPHFCSFQNTSLSHERGCSCTMGDENLGHWVELHLLSSAGDRAVIVFF